jgi:hypothetical protein
MAAGTFPDRPVFALVFQCQLAVAIAAEYMECGLRRLNEIRTQTPVAIETAAEAGFVHVIVMA